MDLQTVWLSTQTDFPILRPPDHVMLVLSLSSCSRACLVLIAVLYIGGMTPALRFVAPGGSILQARLQPRSGPLFVQSEEVVRATETQEEDFVVASTGGDEGIKVDRVDAFPCCRFIYQSGFRHGLAGTRCQRSWCRRWQRIRLARRTAVPPRCARYQRPLFRSSFCRSRAGRAGCSSARQCFPAPTSRRPVHPERVCRSLVPVRELPSSEPARRLVRGRVMRPPTRWSPAEALGCLDVLTVAFGQLSFDGGSLLRARELLWEREPPTIAYSASSVETARRRPCSALCVLEWAKVAFSRLRDLDDWALRKRRLTNMGPTEKGRGRGKPTDTGDHGGAAGHDGPSAGLAPRRRAKTKAKGKPPGGG